MKHFFGSPGATPDLVKLRTESELTPFENSVLDQRNQALAQVELLKSKLERYEKALREIRNFELHSDWPALRVWDHLTDLATQAIERADRIKELEAQCKALLQKLERYENELRDMRMAVDELWNSISTEGSTIEGYIVNVAKLTAVRHLAIATQALEEPK